VSSTPNRASRRHPDAGRRRYVSIGETAEYLGVTERTVRDWITDGSLTAYSLANRFYRLDLDEVDEAMKPVGGSVA
jgi:excisionase family DNA binding protein